MSSGKLRDTGGTPPRERGGFVDTRPAAPGPKKWRILARYPSEETMEAAYSESVPASMAWRISPIIRW